MENDISSIDKKIQILLIDDDEAFNHSLKECLEYEGYEVMTAFDGKQGLMLFNQTKPDLVITDIFMPAMDGVEFLFKIIEYLQTFPGNIIAISGGGGISGRSYLELIKDIGVDNVLEKPFELIDLQKLIQKILHQNHTDCNL